MDDSNFKILVDKVDLLGYDLVEVLILNNRRDLLNLIDRWRSRKRMDGYGYWVVELNNWMCGYILATGKVLTTIELNLTRGAAVTMFQEQCNKDEKKLDGLKQP